MKKIMILFFIIATMSYSVSLAVKGKDDFGDETDRYETVLTVDDAEAGIIQISNKDVAMIGLKMDLKGIDNVYEDGIVKIKIDSGEVYTFNSHVGMSTTKEMLLFSLTKRDSKKMLDMMKKNKTIKIALYGGKKMGSVGTLKINLYGFTREYKKL
ncbi:MAG: hypothetical protein KAH04_01370 [Psychrilyobacter sp.]|nr:hypothetical protein [Psychrilyobacter sp.]